MGTADFADWSRLGAGCRRLATKGSADFEQILGVLAHAFQVNGVCRRAFAARSCTPEGVAQSPF